jgi:hypothetical protein
MTATALRTPGIMFTVVPPATQQTLPRMDIAGLVGFAASGPIDTPVPIEDPSAYTAIFGADLLLARDDEATTDVYCNLGPAVRSFFANGGQRCWVVRVARDADTDLVQVPGLVTRLADGSLVPASLAARSAGTWADGVSVSAALGSELVDVISASLGTNDPQLVVDAASDIAAGDTIRLTVGVQTAIMVVGEDATDLSDSYTTTRTVRIVPNSILFVRDAVAWADPLPMPGESGVASMRSVSPAATTAPATFTGISDSTVTLTIAESLSPDPGQYVLVEGLRDGGGRDVGDLWLVVDDVHTSPTDASTLIVEGSAQFVAPDTAGLAALFEVTPVYAERLTLDLFAQPAGGAIAQLAGLGFALGHPAWIGLLPSDEQLFDPVTPSSDDDDAARVWKQSPAPPLWGDDGTPSLWTRLATPRFPVAAAIGDDLPLVGPISYPLVMPVFETHWMTPAFDPELDLIRDGLEHFDSRLFVDDGLRGDRTNDLLADADRLSTTGPEPAPLHGLHALLYNDEVTLVCVPDASQRGWIWAEAEPPGWLPPSPRFVMPTTPGAFTECGTELLPAPTLSPPVLGLGPSASPPVTIDGGVFTLSWTESPAAADYIVQQSVDPTFTSATTYYKGSAGSVTIYALDAGQEPGAGTYFRVRAIAGSSQSNWSNTVQLIAGPALRPVQIPADEYEPDTLIDVHRALLRAAGARGDVFVVLALPGHYNEQQTRAHIGQLQTAVIAAPAASPPFEDVPPLPQSENSTYSFGALYHPWVVIVESDGTTTAIPPDGPAMGVLSALAAPAGSAASLPSVGASAARVTGQPPLVGAWMSPGNIPLTGVVALTPALSAKLLPPGAVARVNILSQVPTGFVSLSAWTMSTDRNLTDINVRRLLCELRRMAMLLGPRYVFEPNDARLVHAVSRDFEALLTQLFTEGAFAGPTPATSYFLNVTTGADPASGLDPAELRVQIGVAPSVPLRFLTVQLTQEAGGVTQVGGS